MSNISVAARPEFDFWEFVTCARCHLPYASDSGVPGIPFWLTECGHIVCNNHLSHLMSALIRGFNADMSDQMLIRAVRNVESKESSWFRCSKMRVET